MISIYEIIAKKRDGLELNDEEISFIIGDYVKGNIPDYQMSAFLMAVYIRGMTDKEISFLTLEMMKSGDIISLKDVEGKSIDKHSTGGVGDKISLILAPMTASCGINVPMLAGRGLGHTGGTLDKLESIKGFNVFLKTDQFINSLKKTGIVISGQTENIVPADRKMYSLRDATATVSSIPLIASSIMSKKLSLQSDGIVMDIKTGNGAFMNKMNDAVDLAKKMIAISENSGRKMAGLITNMNKPLGSSVGNALEVIESIECLKGKGNRELMEITYSLGSYMLITAGKEDDFYRGVERLKDAVLSGKALNKFREFVISQGGDDKICDDYNLLPSSQIKDQMTAKISGYISEINTYEVGLASIDIGAGRKKKEDSIDHGTGFVFNKNTGDKITKGEPILTLYGNDEYKLSSAKKRLENAIKISEEKPPLDRMIYYYIDKFGLKEWDKKF
jgi:pyrimidine-nucleoside phosphorylase